MTKQTDITNFGQIATEKLRNGLQELYFGFGLTVLHFLTDLARAALFSGNPKSRAVRAFKEGFARFHKRHRLPMTVMDQVLALQQRIVEEVKVLMELRRSHDNVPVAQLTALNLRIQDTAQQLEKVIQQIATVDISESKETVEQMLKLRARRATLAYDLDILTRTRDSLPTPQPGDEAATAPAAPDDIPGVAFVDPANPHGDAEEAALDESFKLTDVTEPAADPVH